VRARADTLDSDATARPGSGQFFMSSPSDVLPPRPAARLLVLALVAAAVAMPAQALYKVIGADGKVTYTDRPPSAAEGKVMPLSATGNAVATGAAELPLELRQVVARYPVTLYVVADCSPCDNARSLLRERGVPYAERIVVTAEDADTVQRLTGSRDVPALTIGSQILHGFSADNWTAYLNAAGYPRESRLPTNYQYAAATPVTQRVESTRPPAAASAAAPSPVADALPASPSGIRF
jgi:glutaredoxin